MSETIRQFIRHAKMVHRQEFPHENPVNMSNPSEQAERYFWLIGFLNHCAETFNADANHQIKEPQIQQWER